MRRLRMGAGAIALGLALLLGPPATADEPTAQELLDATDDIARGESSHGTMTMQVKTDRYERTVRMEMWTLGTEKSLIRILDPAKERGTATLKVEDNIWNYLPKVDRTVKLPPAMMSGNWMGSHITNDDLVRESRMTEEFTFEITGRPEGDSPEGVFTIDLVPKPDAPVVWGKVVVQVRRDKLPVRIEYYDEDGTLMRTMSFEDVQEMGGRTLPTVYKVIPADAPEEFTMISYDQIEFGVDIDDSRFTLQSLKR